MAEQTSAAPLPHHDKGNVPLCQPLPLPLSSPRTRITRPGVGRRHEAAPLPIPIEFVDVGGALPPSSLCPPIAPPEGTAVRARDSVGSAGVPGEGQNRGGFQVPEEVPPPSSQALAGQAGRTLVLGGEDLSRCVVVDLQGNVVVQETPPAVPSYLVDQPILVQVGPEANQGSGSGVLGVPSVGSHTKTAVRDAVGGDGNTRPPGQTNGGKKAEFEPRWSFREVEVKEDRHPKEPPHLSEESPAEESAGEDAGRPRRKSAKRARQRWKSISEVEGGRGGVGRVRRPHLAPPRDKTHPKGEEMQQVMTGAEGREEVPVWAQHLSWVGVVDIQWGSHQGVRVWQYCISHTLPRSVTRQMPKEMMCSRT